MQARGAGQAENKRCAIYTHLPHRQSKETRERGQLKDSDEEELKFPFKREGKAAASRSRNVAFSAGRHLPQTSMAERAGSLQLR